MTTVDIIIDELIIEDDRPDHIAKHDVLVEEVTEIISSDYVFIEGKLGRWRIIGMTKRKRFLTVIIGEREAINTYGLVTARPSSKEERSLYIEFIAQKG